MGCNTRCRQTADYFVPEIAAVALAGFGPLFLGGGIGPVPEALAGEFGLGEQGLGVVYQIVELAYAI